MSPPTQSADSSAATIPPVGLGTWKNDDPATCERTVKTAIEMGYRHIDTAQIYDNEAAVGRGIAAAAVDREEVFVATKLWIDSLAAADVVETTEASLRRLGLDRIDLLYVHWPARTYDPHETLRAFDKLHEAGMVDHIGLSNFEPDQLRAAVEISDAPIVANQIECHPLFRQSELRAVCEAQGVDCVAYSPLARGGVFEEPTIRAIADDHDATPAAVSLAWLRQRGVVAIPKATGEAHLRDNWQSQQLSLSDDELDRIESIDETGRCVDPAFAPWN